MANKGCPVVILTGCNGGIGAAIHAEMEASGCFVIGIDKSLGEAQDRIDTPLLRIDLSQFSFDEHYQTESILKIKQQIPENMSRLIVVNNAAIQILKGISDLSISDWQESFNVNTLAPFFLVKGLREILIRTKGQVVNVSSIHAKLTKPNFSSYATSKAALEAITRSLALELGPFGVSVNAVAPAAIMTEMLRAGFAGDPSKLNQLLEYHPTGSIGSVTELAEFIRSLALEQRKFLNGAVFDFSGGIHNRLHDPQ